MALIDFSKRSIFVSFTIVVPQLVGIVAHASANNAASTNEDFEPNISAGYLREYYTPQIYQKYSAQRENQVQTAVEAPETLLSSRYKAPVSGANYVVAQVTVPPQATHEYQGSNPYPHAVARVVPPSLSHATFGLESKHEEIPKKFHYGYRVSNPHTGTEFGHSEVSDGSIVKGYYHVLLPDGRLQNVRYLAGPSGYHATITYETRY